MLDNARVRLASLGPLALRLGLGVGFMLHGWDKFHGLLNGQVPGATAEMFWPKTLGWMIGTTEFVGGLCLIVGLLTRFWAAGMVIGMGVAITRPGNWESCKEVFTNIGCAVSNLFQGQWDALQDCLDNACGNVFGMINPWVFGMVALGLFLLGPGCWSIDHLIGLIVRRRNANAVVGLGMRYPAREFAEPERPREPILPP